jgi:hypothetical protein
VAVKPEKVLRLLQELDEWPARERPGLEYCLGLCCERMCSDQKWFWVV